MKNSLLLIFFAFSFLPLFSQDDNTIIVAVKSVEKSFSDFEAVNEYCTRNPEECKQFTWLHYSKIDVNNLIIEYPDISGNYILKGDSKEYKVQIEGRKIAIDGKEALFYFDARVQILFVEFKKDVYKFEEYQGDWIGEEYQLINELSVVDENPEISTPDTKPDEPRQGVETLTKIEKEVEKLRQLDISYSSLYNRYNRTSKNKNGFSMQEIDLHLGGTGKGFKKKMATRILENL